MQLIQSLSGLLLASSLLPAVAANPAVRRNGSEVKPAPIAPKVFIVSMFEPEAAAWWGIPEFDLLAHNITVPGASPLFPDVHCTPDHSVCQLITGEGEINAAITVSSIAFSPLFDLSHTYFLVAGIAGINPEQGTICAASFARFAIQVALQYEIDLRELPGNYSTSYIPQGAQRPSQYPTSIYGTEVFEVNAELRALAAGFARKANLSDSDTAKAYRANYANATGDIYKAATRAPSILECDVATTDVYYSGELLGEAFSNTTAVWTNGTGTYCSSAQEDNATLEALLRASLHEKLDFSRIVVMRTASDFERPYPGQAALDNLMFADQGAFEPAVKNLYIAGIEVVKGIIGGWNETFEKGVKPSNYVGDIFGTLGGKPNFGPGRKQALSDAGAITKRGLRGGVKVVA
ncbi:putative purine nucleoside permease [Aspergillus steynii IBT 23096]|uniref:Putative purine nucleoside permease n=1 Tax=Aspergillus steynii IBT 23096 TaxID=1392250 RepID=A0A2I2FRN0_9EURO|nr:putative purine nucleoside permease [Aspergillus steynii IBT 23096]PLB43271.1 putative purine nucleoside permease [Aspergillus steynii IBT 23096]